VTDAPTGPNPPLQFELNVPPEAEAGVFANFAGIWHDNDGFVLDFAAVAEPAQPGHAADGSPIMKVRARVVSRVRIPPRQAFELMRALNTQLDAWERTHGPASPPPAPDQSDT
jgi:hypothetical protein